MSQLSRRSRDNATDLMTLKEATNARDEDIRKSLRELITDAKAKAAFRDPYGGHLLLEGRAHSASPPTANSKNPRPFSLPRIPSPNSFAASLDRESSLATPSLCNSEAPATIALLEKIVREMGTREGQELLLGRLIELSEKLTGMASSEKVDELVRLVKQEQAVVPAGGGGAGGAGNNRGGRNRGWSFNEDDDGARPREIGFNQSGPMAARVSRLLQEQEARRSSAPASQANDVVN
jgi:hypothetical protein